MKIVVGRSYCIVSVFKRREKVDDLEFKAYLFKHRAVNMYKHIAYNVHISGSFDFATCGNFCSFLMKL